jgi:transposase-like protein
VSPKVKSLAARIGEHQKKFLGAGGKPRGLKYPVPWQVEAARLQSELKVPVSDLARELGVGHSALLRWCKQGEPAKSRTQPKSRPKPRPQPNPVKASFVPLAIVTGSSARPTGTSRAAAMQVTLREITVDIASDADDRAVAAVIAMLVRGGRQAPC